MKAITEVKNEFVCSKMWAKSCNDSDCVIEPAVISWNILIIWIGSCNKFYDINEKFLH